jgi:putative acetyltransferase
MTITITPLRPDQIAETRRMIYSVAHGIFHEEMSLEEAIAFYQENWKLSDLDTYQQGYVENGGAFLVTSDNGRIIGSGGLRRLEEKVGEIKRLWFLPAYHGQGLGYQMMQRLIELARQNGYEKLRLETSRIHQPRAYAFYRRLGFYDIPRFGDDPEDVALEMLLGQAGLPGGAAAPPE